MKFVAAVKHYQKNNGCHFNQVFCRAGLAYSDAIIVDMIMGNFTIEQYASTAESCGFDLH
jgi:hypothetical protein